MIQGVFNWLSEHRLINLLLVSGYVLFLIFAHDSFVNLSVELMNSLSLSVYNRVVAIIFTFVLLALLGLFYRALNSKFQVERSGFLFAGLVLCGLVFHFFVFTEMNIEFIHALEFGLLAVIIFPLVGRYGAAIIYALPVMLIDEWYQYIILYPDYVEYFDFNDIFLDLLGAGLFMSLLKIFRIRNSKTNPSFFQRSEFYLLLFIGLVVAALMSLSIVVSYTDQVQPSTWLVLSTIQENQEFWRVHPLIGSTYHVLQPITGMLLVFSLCAVYLGMDSIRSEK